VKFVIHPVRLKRLEQIAPDVFRKLTLMNYNLRRGQHAKVVVDSNEGNKSALRPTKTI
jgi:hypothetical protein